MAEITARYDLALLETGQAQKEITHNAAIDQIDALLHLAVESRSVPLPSASPAVGSSWIVPPSAVGAWADSVGKIAVMTVGGWLISAPRDGCLAWIGDEQLFAVFRAGVWDADAWPVAALRIGTRDVLRSAVSAIVEPAGGAVVDVEARAILGQLIAGLRAVGIMAL